MLLTLLMVSTLSVAYYIRTVTAQPTTIYINLDGSITPYTAPILTVDGTTYFLTGDISYPNYDGIVVCKCNIVIDGNSHALIGQGNLFQGDFGLNEVGTVNVTTENFNIQNFTYAIYLANSQSDIIKGNNMSQNYAGVFSYDNSYGANITGNNITGNYEGIYLRDSSNNNTISSNELTANRQHGIELSSNYNTVIGNTITGNGCGIDLSSSENIFIGNNVTGNGNGIFIESSSNLISGNEVIANSNGIVIGISAYWNILTGNNLANNQYGLTLFDDASNNTIYRNNFVENTCQVSINAPSWGGAPSLDNSWNQPYPVGGNYWSDYHSADMFNGVYQNITGSDGICDIPYAVDSNNTDNYPLVNPYPSIDVAIDGLAIPNVVRKGDCCSGNLTVVNEGDLAENFKVTVYANNATIVASLESVSLQGHESALLPFFWDTSEFDPGNYTLSAYATPVPGETNITDNTSQSGIILIVPLMSGGGTSNGLKSPPFSARD
jgi:parallel beta-helix repeat protein